MKYITIPPANLDESLRLNSRYNAAWMKYVKEASTVANKSIKASVVSKIPVVTGDTRRSIMQKVIGGTKVVHGVVYSNAKGTFKGPFVLNFGRKSKAMPAHETNSRLFTWVTKKIGGIGSVSKAKQITYLIARAIARNGTKGLHYMAEALSENITTINTNLAAAADKIVAELKNGK